MPSRTGDTLSDKVAKRSLEQLNINYKLNSFSDRGSDERQYCSPRVNLPVSSVMRSKYGSYPEYHTSKDDLTFISKKGLHESFEYFKHLIQQFENNRIPIAELFGEPMLSKRNLRSSIGGTYLESDEHLISQVLAYSDGSNDTLEMAKILNVSIQKIESLINLLSSHKLVKLV
jgi:aminopeptidase-like protein